MSYDPHLNDLLDAANITAGTTNLTHLSDSGQIADASGGTVTINLPEVANCVRKIFIFKKTDATANTVVINRAGSDTIDGATSYTLTTQYDSLILESDDVAKWVIVGKYSTAGAPATLEYTLSSKSANFTANDTSGTFYQITASSAIAVTLPASPADGTVYKFIVVSGNGLVTFTADGSETILNGSQVSKTMTLKLYAGSPELIAVTGGWQVT